MMMEKCCASTGSSILEEHGDDSKVPERQVYLTAARCALLQEIEDKSEWYQMARGLLEERPDSTFARLQVVFALSAEERHNEAIKLVREGLEHAADRDMMEHLLLNLACNQEDHSLMWELFDNMENEGKLDANDYNTVAWTCLFGNGDIEKGLRLARTSVKLSNGKPSYLHTLAALYAEVGRIREAREALIQSMEADGKVVPDENDWYVLGRIAEELGEIETAIHAYRKVNEPEKFEDPTLATYKLAHQRLQMLGETI